MDELQLIATATAGLEACVKRELVDLGFSDARVLSPGRVAFRSDQAGLARANLWLRTADRVLLVVGAFGASDFGELFDRTQALDWERWIPTDGKFPVAGRSYKSTLTSVPACQRSVKKAIVEKLRASHGVTELPETGADYAIEIALREDSALLTLDTTGPGLNKRGYRAAAGPAPLKETLAAALVQLSFWKPDRPLVDPFCGSGTIPIEAAMIGRNIAPGLKRTFAAERWGVIDAGHWATERERARDLIQPALPQRIIGTDIEPKAISLSSHHADLAGVAEDIHFQQKPFQELASSREYGCVICNPPYGKRFENGAEVMEIYRSMGDVFRLLKTWSFFVITSVDLEKILGQPADRRRKLYNGRIECLYYQFHGPRRPRGSQETIRTAVGDEPPPPAKQATPAFGGMSAKAPNQVEIFSNRLKRTARHLRRWPARGITCYRLYDRDIPEVPLAVDVYDGHLHIAEYDRPHERSQAQHTDWLDLMTSTAADVLGIPRENAFLKRRQRQRGTDQYGKFAEKHCRFTVCEGGLKFEVNLSDYLDTGLFLDHRITRDSVRKEASGRRMLNLFAYTGAFSVYAADGGASATTSVDLSKTYLDWAKRNMVANDFTGAEHRSVQTNAMEFLRDHAPGEYYDLVVVDPPTFSNSKRTDTDFDIQRDYAELLRATTGLMPAGGVIYFSTNFRRFKLDPTALPKLNVLDISRQTIPDDFRNKRIHRCWRMVVK
jgi:23S rRNA (guanine2069-N7)-methyltransferase / 23S rRNA (guanine2445-N2)-methyltransferase